jgi:hypothetical protein
MKKYILILGLGLLSCEKDEPTVKEPSCQCRKDKQQLGAGGNWNVVQQGTTYVDFCSNNGLIEPIDIMTRYKTTCW